MADDLANHWGVNLCNPEHQRRPSISPSFRSLPRTQSLGNRPSLALIPGLVAAETEDFVFERVAVSGSQANSWAIEDATEQNTSLCLFAAGSYVAGDGSALQSFSTSDFSTQCELALIMLPSEVKIACGRANTVPLPYHIPGVLQPKRLMEYEDECFQAIHTRLCWAKMCGNPYKTLLLELILAGNGAMLSDRALIAIAKLAVFHNLSVIVDEIMTGGRTGQMFYLLSKPPSFQKVVTHITMGKFIKLGMVFLSKSWAEKRKEMYPFTQRGASTSLGAEDAVLHWRCVKMNLSGVAKKRENVIKKLRLMEGEVWGAGLLLFGACRWDTPRGLKCRYLPLVHEHTPIDSVKCRKMNHQGQLFRVHVNSMIIKAVKKWMLDSPQPNHNLAATITPASEKRDTDRLFDYNFVSQVIQRSSECDEKPAEQWIKEFMPSTVNRHNGEAALSRMESAGGFRKTLVGIKRKRHWKLQPGFVTPWKLPEYDDDE